MKLTAQVTLTIEVPDDHPHHASVDRIVEGELQDMLIPYTNEGRATLEIKVTRDDRCVYQGSKVNGVWQVCEKCGQYAQDHDA